MSTPVRSSPAARVKNSANAASAVPGKYPAEREIWGASSDGVLRSAPFWTVPSAALIVAAVVSRVPPPAEPPPAARTVLSPGANP